MIRMEFATVIGSSLLDEYTNIEFEGITFMAYKRYKYYSKTVYGDYMTLPPIEARKPIHIKNKTSNTQGVYQIRNKIYITHTVYLVDKSDQYSNELLNAA